MTQPKARKPTKAMLMAERAWKTEFAANEMNSICPAGHCVQCDLLRKTFRDGYKAALRGKKP